MHTPVPTVETVGYGSYDGYAAGHISLSGTIPQLPRGGRHSA
jgi:hypothetical protein